MLIRLLLLVTLGLLAKWVPAMEIAEDRWRLVKSQDGIQVYMAHSDESRLKTFRGVTQLDLPDPYALAAVLDDYPAAPKWLHFVDSIEGIGRNSEMDRFVRVTTHLPWPLKDREALVRTLVEQDPETLDVDVRFINSPELLPKNKHFTRFPEFYGHLKVDFINAHSATITYEVIVDPGGFVPLWISNLILKDSPYFTLKRLKKMLNKPEYQGVHFSYLKVPVDVQTTDAGALVAADNTVSDALQKTQGMLAVDTAETVGPVTEERAVAAAIGGEDLLVTAGAGVVVLSPDN